MLLALMSVWFTNINLGSVKIPITKVFSILKGDYIPEESWTYIITNYRLPKSICALLVGAGLGISGLLMQTLFRNPLAGPFVLGISSGASLGVALLVLGTGFLGGFLGLGNTNSWSIAIASSLGSFSVLMAVLIAIKKVKNTMSILIIGLMFGSISAAVINILSFLSNAEKLQQFVFWGLGSLGNVSWNELAVFAVFLCLSSGSLVFIVKPLNSLLLGENYAKSMGVDLKKTRTITLITTSIITGVITAFSGPIAFIGLAVPHLTKLIFSTSDHKLLLPAVAINGAILMLICDTISQLPGSDSTLPINAVTSLFGAPIVIWLLIRKKQVHL